MKPDLCPYLYPSFMDPWFRAIEVADNAFYESAGRWAEQHERAEYIALIDTGNMPGTAGYAVAAKYNGTRP